MIDTLTDEILASLAVAIARGQSVRVWARQHGVSAELAEDSRGLPAFGELVDAHRLRAADQMSGKLMTAAAAAVDEIGTTLRHSPDAPAKLTAGRSLVDLWLRVSLRFDQMKQLAELKAGMVELDRKVHARASH